MQTSSLERILDGILARKGTFLVVFGLSFVSLYGFFAAIDFLPEPPQPLVSEVSAPEVVEPTPEVVVAEPEEESELEVVAPMYPTELRIPALEKRLTVLNPTSRTIADLDDALLRGVVRHPDSATLEQKGTVFVLGHSSYLPSVRNPAFQAFNEIQNLEFGDEIIAEAAGGTFVYRVEKVYRARASEVVVPIAGDTQRLVLATCNSFGSTDDRYIVEAVLIKETIL